MGNDGERRRRPLSSSWPREVTAGAILLVAVSYDG
uniref:Uncharacterized protein n=1 Tax=Arundo donax TaxID=35708 RepID=A0A0A9BCH7_ARUDO